jgi:hypothetical protein
VVVVKVWKWHIAVLGIALMIIGVCSSGLAQIEIPFPWTQPGTYTGNAIDFGAVPVGTTKTATYTFKILETSETSATVTITRPNAPFGSDAPTGSFTLAPGQSITFNLTFTPPNAGNYTGSFTITAKGGYPVQVKTTTVTLTGQGVTREYPPGAVEEPAVSTYPEAMYPASGEIAKIARKLDTVGVTLAELRQKLDNLAGILGEWIVGRGQRFYIEPGTTAYNPAPPSEGIKPEIEDLQRKIDLLIAQLSEPGLSEKVSHLPPVEVTANSGDRFRDFLALADRLLVRTAQDVRAINPEDTYTQEILASFSEFVLAGRGEVSQLISLSQAIPLETQAQLDAVVIDGAPEILYEITSGNSKSPKFQVELDAGGNEVVSTVLEKAGMALSSVPILGGLFNAVLNDAAKLFEGNSELAELVSGMSLAQLELELKLDAIVRGLFGVSIDDTMDETTLRERLRQVTLGDIPTRLERLRDGVENNSQKIDDLAGELRAKVDNLARELGLTLRGMGYQVEPGTTAPPYTGPNYSGSSLADRIELLRQKLDNLARILGLALYGKDMGFPNGFNIEPFTTVPAGEEVYKPIKPEIEKLESEVRIIKEKLQEILDRLVPAGGTPSPDKAPPVIVPPQPPPGYYEYTTEQLAQTKKIYVYDQGTFTSSTAGDYKEINVTTAAFDLSGWIDLTELRDGDAVTVTVEVSVAGGPFHAWSTTTFSDEQERGLKYFTEFANGLPQVVGTNVKVTIAQTTSADAFVTPVPIYYQFIVESQN